MKIYVALLRGINVGGFKKIRMADLKGHLEELGWEGIQTYIQSGNIVFSSADGLTVQLAQKIKQKLQDKYGFEVPTLVLESRELMHIIKNNPFSSIRIKIFSYFIKSSRPNLKMISLNI